MSVDKTTPSVLEPVAGDEVHEGAENDCDEAIHLPDRIARYTNAKKQSQSMVGYISELAIDSCEIKRYELSKLASKLDDCASYLLFKNYYLAGKVRLAQAYFCKKHTLCQMCAIRRGAKALKAYMDRYSVIKQDHSDLVLHSVTMTIANGDDLKERYEHLQASLKKYITRRRLYLSSGRGFNEFCKAEGAVYSYEVTNKGKGWHPHVHMLMLLKKDNPIDKFKLSEEWEKITGDSYIVHEVEVQSVDDENQSDGFMEVLKYALKFSDLTNKQIFYCHEKLKGKRMVGSFGLFRGVKVPEEMLDDQLDDEPYIELLYQYFKGKGYSITDSGQITLEAKNSSGEP